MAVIVTSSSASRARPSREHGGHGRCPDQPRLQHNPGHPGTGTVVANDLSLSDCDAIQAGRREFSSSKR